RSLFLSNQTPTPQIYTLSLHDALPISRVAGHDRGRCIDDRQRGIVDVIGVISAPRRRTAGHQWEHQRDEDPHAIGGSKSCARRGDRKSTRLNSSHRTISYAVFCLKKKK